MSVIDEVRREREDLARVLKKHTGIRKIVEDLYPDSAHFIFELLQNAEDRGATEVGFTLSESVLRFEHNGESFRPQDIYAITDIGEGTKAGDEDKIGRFGVGFKSVFAYSETPHIWSPTYSFKITDLVLPSKLESATDLAGQTRFDFPFNNPKKSPVDASREIETGLNDLAETTLLFLRHIEAIRWQIEGGRSGDILRVEHSDHHVEMLKQVDGKTATSAHFLKFEEPVSGVEKQRASVAFALDFLPNIQAFSSSKPICKQLRVVPVPGQVAVFFPAEKETSGLRFHVHAPFVPELSRASIKETPANKPLFEQLAALSASSLHSIRDLGLLTIDFLGVLPNPQDQLGQRYAGIRDAVVSSMNNEPLTPTYAKGHAPAQTLVQAKASLKELLGPGDLEFLIEYDADPPEWAVTATQKNSNADRLLTSLQIEDWGIDEFADHLSGSLCEGTRYIHKPSFHIVSGPDQNTLNWLASKPLEWHQSLYALLNAELGPAGGLYRFKERRIVRLANGNYSTGIKCFFPDEGDVDDEALPRVESATYNSGKSPTQKANARSFLEAIGVRTVGEVEQVEAILEQRYSQDAPVPDAKTYLLDLRRFITFTEKNPASARIFQSYFIFERSDNDWATPEGVYIDEPFLETGLSAFFDALGEDADALPLAPNYEDCRITPKRIGVFAKAVGSHTELVPTKIGTSGHPQRSELRADYLKPGVRWTDSAVDEDWEIDGLDVAIKTPSEALSKLIWATMSGAPSRVLQARFRPNQRYDLKGAPSSLVLLLQKADWIPQKGGPFVKPSKASRDLLPDGFSFDPGQPWLKAVNFGAVAAARANQESATAALAKTLGFEDKDSLDRAKRFAALPLEEQEKILADREHGATVELPEHEPKNTDRRAERVAQRAEQAPERRTETRERSVSVERDAIKVEADEYLIEQYTNPDAIQVCQICKDALPFRLDDGSYYFETVELLAELHRHHFQNYLCLCPNHSAMFRHVNASRGDLAKAIMDLTGNELSVILAQEELTIYFTKTHLFDLREIMQLEQLGANQPDGDKQVVN